jgi:hypothetical protein
MKRRFSLFIVTISLVWVAALAAYGFVWAIDPYELRSVRPGEQLALHAYPEDVTPRLAPAAAAEGVDVAIVGGSTAMGYTPLMMRRAFPRADHPVNLAYPCATGGDLALILRRLEATPRLKRLIISLDFTLMWPCISAASPLDPRYYQPSWYDPAPEFNPTSIELANSVLRTGMLDMPAWRPRVPDRVDGVNFAPALTTQPAEIAAITRDAEIARSTVTSDPEVSCAAIPALARDVFPSVHRLAARGVKVDLLAPPYSLAFYFRSSSSGEGSATSRSLFARLMAIRRCALAASAGIPGVQFHSFDTDLSIVGNLSEYGDVGHIRDYATYDRILRGIAAGGAVVAPDRWDAVEAQLKSELTSYSPPALARSEPASPS